MKLIIAGSRDHQPTFDEIDFYVTLFVAAMNEPIEEIVSGGCRGVDRAGELWAKKKGIPVKVFPADWDTHGRAAGPIRNREMAEYADGLIAIIKGKSRGTRNMVKEAEARDLHVFEHQVW